MNFTRIIGFTVLLTIMQVIVHTATYMVFGDVKPIGSITYFVNLYLPSVLVSIFVLSLFVMRQNYKVYIHLLLVSALSSIIMIGGLTILIGEYISSPFWYIDFAISITCIFISVKIGRNLKAKLIVTAT